MASNQQNMIGITPLVLREGQVEPWRKHTVREPGFPGTPKTPGMGKPCYTCRPIVLGSSRHVRRRPAGPAWFFPRVDLVRAAMANTAHPIPILVFFLLRRTWVFLLCVCGGAGIEERGVAGHVPG